MRRRWPAIVVIALLAACGSTSQNSPEPTPLPNVFDKVDIGGYRLAYQCVGSGSPTIIAEAGYNIGGTTAFAGVLEPIGQISRICTYDRAGTGNSDDRPRSEAKGLTSEDQARELHALLQAAAIEPPYVVVAHSYGGFVSRLFAATYPDETIGLVLIESSHEDEIVPYRRYFRDDPKEADWVDGGDLLDIDATAAALRAKARDFGSMPLIVIRAETYDDVLSESLWRRTQADLATLSTDGIEIEASHSGHFVQDDNPDVVVGAVRAVVDAARAGAPLAACADIIAGLDVRCLT
ncbi:MAG: alpha/beta hydrolase [Actinomycetota bacterium]|nr:alpha/beta hydrolase [Actinomycetota bacterium]